MSDGNSKLSTSIYCLGISKMAPLFLDVTIAAYLER